MSSQKMSNKQLVLRIKAGENVADNMLQALAAEPRIYQIYCKEICSL